MPVSVFVSYQHIAADTIWPPSRRRHFKRIFINENIIIFIKMSLQFVPHCLINNIPKLVQIMVWCRPGDKPISEPMTVRLPTDICVRRPEWVNTTVLEFVTDTRIHRVIPGVDVIMICQKYINILKHNVMWSLYALKPVTKPCRVSKYLYVAYRIQTWGRKTLLCEFCSFLLTSSKPRRVFPLCFHVRLAVAWGYGLPYWWCPFLLV